MALSFLAALAGCAAPAGLSARGGRCARRDRAGRPLATLLAAALPTLLLAVLLAGCGASQRRVAAPQRIIALAPNVAEILFELGLGDRVVGVGDYARWPPEVATKQRIGGLFGARLEQISRLEPDLAVLLPSEAALRSQLERLGVEVLTVRSETIADVAEAVETIGARCGAEQNARRMLDAWWAGLEPDMLPPPSPRVILAVGRELGRLTGVVVAGPGTYLDELLGRVGAVNAFEDAPLLYPQVGLEEIVQRGADVLIELQPVPIDPDRLVGDWQELPGAGGPGRCIRVIAGDHALVPGPRMPRLLREIREILTECAAGERPAEGGAADEAAARVGPVETREAS